MTSPHYTDGMKAYDAGDFKKAVKLFTKYLKTNPTDGYALCIRGNSYVMLSDYQSALNDLNEACKLDPSDAWALSSRAECYRMADKYQEALEDFNKSLQLDSGNNWVRGLRADCLRRTGKCQEALEDLAICLQADPQSTFALYTRALCHKQMKNYEAAMQDFDAVLALDPKYMNTVKQREETLALMNPKTSMTPSTTVTNQSVPAQPVVQKVQRWHFDRTLQEGIEWTQMDSYSSLTLNSSLKEFSRVMQIIPVSSGPSFLGYHEVTKVDLIWNKELEKSFEDRVKLLQSRVEKEFQPTWSQEEKPQERMKVSQRLLSYVSHFPPQPDNVKIVPVWFGTTLSNALKICSTGFGHCYTDGNFGRGVYLSNSAEYALQFSPKDHVALLCWIVLGNTYPVVHGDQIKLSEVAQYKNYDSYFAPVAPIGNQFLPPIDATAPKYDLYVLLQDSQVLPRYLIQFIGKKPAPVVAPVTSPTKIFSVEHKTPPPSAPTHSSIPRGGAKSWKVNEVCTWLASLNLSQDYSKIFVKNAIDGDVLLTLTSDDLKELGITIFGDVRKLQKGIKEL